MYIHSHPTSPFFPPASEPFPALVLSLMNIHPELRFLFSRQSHSLLSTGFRLSFLHSFSLCFAFVVAAFVNGGNFLALNFLGSCLESWLGGWDAYLPIYLFTYLGSADLDAVFFVVKG